MEQSNALAVQPVGSTVGIPTSQELMVYQAWANNAVDSQMYRSIGKASAIMMIMLAAREYGIGPAQALNGGLHIIEGKVELSARMMSSLIRKRGHKIEPIEESNEKCTIKGTRADNGEVQTVTYTIAMAEKGGLIKEKGAWKKTPEDMLYARALSRLARRLFSDVIGIGYVEGEISDSRADMAVLEPVRESSNQPVDIEVAASKKSESEMLTELVDYIGEEKSQQIQQYIQAVSQHFKWTFFGTLKNLLEDKEKTLNKFNTWVEQNAK